MSLRPVIFLSTKRLTKNTERLRRDSASAAYNTRGDLEHSGRGIGREFRYVLQSVRDRSTGKVD